MKVKVITLPNSTERQNYIKQTLDFPFSFFFALDGSKFKLKHGMINSQAVSTFLSHVSLMLQLLNDEDDIFLILEDDILAKQSYDTILEKIQTLPEDWDIALLGWYDVDSFSKKIEINSDWVKVNKFWGLHAYLIKKEKIEKIYNSLLAIDGHIDLQLSRLITEKKINGYFVKNPIFHQNGNFKSQINIK